jgi:hypothetical protein
MRLSAAKTDTPTEAVWNNATQIVEEDGRKQKKKLAVAEPLLFFGWNHFVGVTFNIEQMHEA